MPLEGGGETMIALLENDCATPPLVARVISSTTPCGENASAERGAARRIKQAGSQEQLMLYRNATVRMR